MRFCHSYFLTTCIQREHTVVPTFTALAQLVVKGRSLDPAENIDICHTFVSWWSAQPSVSPHGSLDCAWRQRSASKQDSWHPPQKCQPQTTEGKVLIPVCLWEGRALVSRISALFCSAWVACPSFLQVGVKVLFGNWQRKITLWS